MPDFWPADVGKSSIITPGSIMREQAALLGEKTNQQVIADVETAAAAQAGYFIDTFVLVVPALGNYKYELFKIQYPITLYPLSVHWNNNWTPVPSQADFVQTLKNILGSDKTKNAVHALLAQVSR